MVLEAASIVLSVEVIVFKFIYNDMNRNKAKTDPIRNARFNTVVKVNKLLAENGIHQYWFELGEEVTFRRRPTLWSRMRYKYWVLRQRRGF